MVDLASLRRFVVNLVRASTSGSTGPHITRYAMYQRLAEASSSWKLGTNLKVLSVSHSQHLCQLLQLRDPQVINANYPTYNLLELPWPDGEYDIVLADQVLEHVRGNPYKAVAESFRVVKPGGLVLHTTCFINPIHDEPGDYWRFTPSALNLMFEQYGTILESGGWGNPYVWIAVMLGLRFERVPEDRNHFLNVLANYNDRQWPIVTWVVAQKPIANNH